MILWERLLVELLFNLFKLLLVPRMFNCKDAILFRVSYVYHHDYFFVKFGCSLFSLLLLNKLNLCFSKMVLVYLLMGVQRLVLVMTLIVHTPIHLDASFLFNLS